MNKTHEIALNISGSQMRKLHNGHKVQLASSDIGSGKTYSVTKKAHTKLQRAKRQGKGVRLSMEDMEMEMEGGDFLKKIGNRNKVIHYANRYGLPAARIVATAAVPVLSKAAGDAVGAYTGSPIIGSLTSSIMKEAGKEGIKQIPKGGSMKKRFTKGSQEAKDYMASLRARKSGGSFKPNGGSFRSGGSFRPNGKSGGSMMSGQLIDGNYNVLPNSQYFNGVVPVNGNPVLKNMKSTESIYNKAPRMKTVSRARGGAIGDVLIY